MGWRIQGDRCEHWMQMNERGTRDGGGCGCQKSRLDLWLIERDTFLGWSGKVGCSVWRHKHRRFYRYPCPSGNRLQSDCASCFSYSLLGQFLTNLEPVPRVPRFCPRTHDLNAPSLNAAFESGFFSENPISRHSSSSIFHLLPKTKEKLFNRPLRMHFHPNSNNIEDVARSPIRSTMSPRESKEIATHRDYCTTKLRVTVLSTPPRLYALKSSILDYRSYLENKIKVVIRRGKEKKVIANQRHNLLTDSLLFLSLLFFPLSTLLLH